jgi:hypothetical protein
LNLLNCLPPLFFPVKNQLFKDDKRESKTIMVKNFKLLPKLGDEGPELNNQVKNRLKKSEGIKFLRTETNSFWLKKPFFLAICSK